jgi:hypothetical protein
MFRLFFQSAFAPASASTTPTLPYLLRRYRKYLQNGKTMLNLTKFIIFTKFGENDGKFITTKVLNESQG